MAIRNYSFVHRVAAIGCAAFVLAACQESMIPKDIRPVPYKLVGEMQQRGMKETSPIFIRIFKEESELEVWKQRRDGKYALLKTFSICKWSGILGPKVQEGDRQAPEGFYTVTPAQMNPKSNYYLSFNMGFPNAYDKALGRTGSNLMVHGACSSAGCYSMTDEAAGEIFALARDAFKGGQRAFQIQAFPFRMTPENLAKHRGDANMEFWKMLKVGYDHFEVTRQPPTVDVCEKRYVFDADAGGATFNANGACPPYRVPEWIATAVAAKEAADEKKMADAAAKMDADAARLAAQKEKLAEQQAAAEDHASKPSVIDRLLGRDKEPAPATPVASETTASVAPVPEPTPRAKGGAAAVAVADAPANPPKPPLPPKKTAATAQPPTPTPAPPVGNEKAPETATAADTPQVGRIVNRKFLWPDDPPAVAGAAEVLPPTLESAN